MESVFKLGRHEKMGVGECPHSNKDIKGKGTPPIHKTKGEVYGNCTGVVGKDGK